MKKILLFLMIALSVNSLHAIKLSYNSITECNQDSFDFVKNGKVYNIYLVADKFRTQVKIYIINRRYYDLNRDLRSINIMLNSEASNERDAVLILKNNVCPVLNTLFNDGYYIDDVYIKKENKDILKACEETHVNFKDVPEYQEYMKKLMTYKRDCKPKINDDGTWEMECSIRTLKGGVYLWYFKGTVFPLQITTFKQDIVAETGIFEEILTIGN